jgi:hypothetical protein
MKFPNYALGLFTGFCLAGLYFMLPTIIDGFRTPAEPKPEPQRFEVVDNYKGCDIIRWENSMLAEYKYFMRCDK